MPKRKQQQPLQTELRKSPRKPKPSMKMVEEEDEEQAPKPRRAQQPAPAARANGAPPDINRSRTGRGEQKAPVNKEDTFLTTLLAELVKPQQAAALHPGAVLPDDELEDALLAAVRQHTQDMHQVPQVVQHPAGAPAAAVNSNSSGMAAQVASGLLRLGAAPAAPSRSTSSLEQEPGDDEVQSLQQGLGLQQELGQQEELQQQQGLGLGPELGMQQQQGLELGPGLGMQQQQQGLELVRGLQQGLGQQEELQQQQQAHLAPAAPEEAAGPHASSPAAGAFPTPSPSGAAAGSSAAASSGAPGDTPMVSDACAELEAQGQPRVAAYLAAMARHTVAGTLALNAAPIKNVLTVGVVSGWLQLHSVADGIAAGGTMVRPCAATVAKLLLRIASLATVQSALDPGTHRQVIEAIDQSAPGQWLQQQKAAAALAAAFQGCGTRVLLAQQQPAEVDAYWQACKPRLGALKASLLLQGLNAPTGPLLGAASSAMEAAGTAGAAPAAAAALAGAKQGAGAGTAAAAADPAGAVGEAASAFCDGPVGVRTSWVNPLAASSLSVKQVLAVRRPMPELCESFVREPKLGGVQPSQVSTLKCGYEDGGYVVDVQAVIAVDINRVRCKAATFDSGQWRVSSSVRADGQQQLITLRVTGSQPGQGGDGVLAVLGRMMGEVFVLASVQLDRCVEVRANLLKAYKANWPENRES